MAITIQRWVQVTLFIPLTAGRAPPPPLSCWRAIWRFLAPAVWWSRSLASNWSMSWYLPLEWC